MARQVPEITIDGLGVKGSRRILSIMQGKPGEVAITVYLGAKPVTVLVPDRTLRAAMEILAIQQKNRLPKQRK